MNQKSHTEAIQYLENAKVEERNPRFRDALMKIELQYLREEEISLLKDIYTKLKDVALRKVILFKLSILDNPELKQFFYDAYKKERYLDLKLIAIRGYANSASQNEVEKLMGHYAGLLKKVPQKTPFDYQEYEFIRSVCGLPYLIKKYGYACFADALVQEEKQYNDMPDAFKGHFTVNEDGDIILLRKPEETKEMLEEFFESKRL